MNLPTTDNAESHASEPPPVKLLRLAQVRRSFSSRSTTSECDFVAPCISPTGSLASQSRALMRLEEEDCAALLGTCITVVKSAPPPAERTKNFPFLSAVTLGREDILMPSITTPLNITW